MLKTLLKILIFLVIIYVVLQIKVAIAFAPEIPFKDWTPQQKAQHFAKEYGANYTEMAKVIVCESNWRPTVYGDGTKAYSYAQFHRPTFDMWAKELGKELDYQNPDDHLELMAYAFSKDGVSYKRAWTCWTKIYK